MQILHYTHLKKVDKTCEKVLRLNMTSTIQIELQK